MAVWVVLTCSYAEHIEGKRSIPIKFEPNMLKSLPIIPSSTSHKIYPLFFFYSHIKAYYSHIKAYYSHFVLLSLAV